MTQDFSLTRHIAFSMLKGPQSIQLDSDFWGEPLICFIKNVLPFTKGMVESKVIYGNLADIEQENCFIRSAVWNAQEDYSLLGNPTNLNKLPTVKTHYELISAERVKLILRGFSNFTIPLSETLPSILLEPQYTLELNWNSRTHCNVSWNTTSEVFLTLTNTFSMLWEELSVQPVNMEEIEEVWSINWAKFLSA